MGDATKFGTILLRIYCRRDIWFVSQCIEPFQSYMLPIDGGLAKFEVFIYQIFNGGESFQK